MDERTACSPAIPGLAHPLACPWPSFGLAAAAAVDHLARQHPLDLWLVTEVIGGEQQVVAAAGAWSPLVPPGRSFAWADSFCVRMLDGRGPAVATDVRQSPSYADVLLPSPSEVRGYIGVPLLHADGDLFGSLCGVAGAPQATLRDALPLVGFAGRMLSTVLAGEALAAERSAAAAHALALSDRDALTGLRNDRGWQDALMQESERCRRYGANASVIALDVDDVVDLDDSDSRPADHVGLVTCAHAILAACRPSDVVARTEAAQFGVVAVECDAACARALTHRIRRALRSVGVSVSVGVASRRVGEDLHGTWRRADEAMGVEQRRRRQLKDVQRSRSGRPDSSG